MNRLSTYKALLYVQWKLQRKELALLTVAAAIATPGSMWGVRSLAARGPMSLNQLQLASNIGPMIAIAVGLWLSMRSFMADGHARHVYPMSLPIRRAQFAIGRVAAGMTLSLLPAVGFLIGALVATEALVPRPRVPGGDFLVFQAHPIALTARFFLATGTAFSIGFGVQYGLGRRATRWLIIIALSVLGTEVAGQLVFGGGVLGPLGELLIGGWSPFRIFVDRWGLFSV